MDMESLLEATRRQLSDPPRTFLQTIISTGGTDRYEIDYAPVRAESMTVHVAGSLVEDDAVQVDERAGVLIFDVPPTEGDSIVVAGTHFRFFTDDELESICQDSLEMHVRRKSDLNGRKLTLERLDPVEDLPLSILCAIQAVYVLITDSAYDIDIHAPDGVTIPRSERFRQLMELLQVLEARYRELCAILGVGMYAVEVLTLRRISKRTNRYIPVYQPMEIDDRSVPKRVKLPMPTYGGDITETGIPVVDLDLYRGDTFRKIVEIKGWSIPVGAILQADIKRYAGSEAAVSFFDVTRIDGDSVLLMLPADRSLQFPERMVWDLECRFPGESGQEVRTLVTGTLVTHKDVSLNRS